jgi:predicted nuclease of predicted toxin-antitoxin system
VARFYSNENAPRQVVEALRRLGHDVLTSQDAGRANARVPDPEVLAFAVAETRIVISYNRRHFPLLHNRRTEPHAGIVLCTADPDHAGQALRIHSAITSATETADRIFRVNRPG